MKRLVDQTLYEILEVPPNAEPPDIKAAYERVRSLYAPGSLATYTLMTPSEAALLTSRIEEAKQTLLDPDARGRYDALLLGHDGAASSSTEGKNGEAPRFVPPVIPAVQPAASPAELLQAAASLVPRATPGSGGASGPRVPILLEHEISPPAHVITPPVACGPQVDVPIPDDSLWTGDALRRVREARGITIRQIVDRTKVTRYHVENIEAERFSALPAPVYLRGILLSIARELRLDGQKVARAYLERAGLSAQQGQGEDKQI